MRRFVAKNYQQMLVALLPEGLAWSRRPESNLGKLMLAEGDGLAHIEAEVFRLLNEANPLFSDEALEDWQRVCRLPDLCSRLVSSEENQRAAVLLKLNRPVGQDAKFFKRLAEAYGETIEVEEIRPFLAGESCAGDDLNEWAAGFMVESGYGFPVPEFIAEKSCAGDDINCFPGTRVAWPVLGEYWQDPYQGTVYGWEIKGLSLKRERFFYSGLSCAGDNLSDWNEGELECRLKKAGPAHTALLFSYEEGEIYAQN